MKTTEQIMELAEDYADFAADHAHECSTPNELALLLNGRAALQAAIEALVQERDALKAEHAFAVKAMTTLQAERDALKSQSIDDRLNISKCMSICDEQVEAAQAELAAIKAQEPVAIRHSFDGYGWMYVDNGHGSSWQEWAKRYPDAEPLYTRSKS